MSRCRILHVPLVEVAIAPKSNFDCERLAAVLHDLAGTDLAFDISTDDEIGQTILRAMDDAQLAAKLLELRDTHRANVEISRPHAAYLETPGHAADIKYTHRRLAGGAGEFAHVRIQFEPGEPGSGIIFECMAPTAALPNSWIVAVENGLRRASKQGPLAGFPFIDFKATLLDGAYHDVDSTPRTFELAARGAIRELLARDAIVLLEPIMKVAITIPKILLSKIADDLRRRRGEVEIVRDGGDGCVLIALVPLERMLGYRDELRRASDGSAELSMQYHHHAEVPPPKSPDDVFPPAIGMRA